MQLSPPAYRVPFRFERGESLLTHRLINVGDDPVYGVTFTLHGGGLMRATTPTLLAPGHGVEVSIAAVDLALATILVVRWFRHDGVEYLWRVSF